MAAVYVIILNFIYIYISVSLDMLYSMCVLCEQVIHWTCEQVFKISHVQYSAVWDYKYNKNKVISSSRCGIKLLSFEPFNT